MIETQSAGYRLFRDMILFCATALLAWLRKWSAGDLLWSLWLSSVLLGYSLLLTALAIGPISRLLQRRSGDSASLPAVLVVPGALFMVGFFTVHFMGFHFVHSMFLNSFFPLATLETSISVGSYVALIAEALSRYWPFVLISALSMGTQFRRAFEHTSDKITMMPYRNVIRMHLMIFLIAGLSSAGVPDLALYPTLILYFFPYGAVRDTLRRQRASAST